MGLQHPDHQFKSGCRLFEITPETLKIKASGVFLLYQNYFLNLGKNVVSEQLLWYNRHKLKKYQKVMIYEQ